MSCRTVTAVTGIHLLQCSTMRLEGVVGSPEYYNLGYLYVKCRLTEQPVPVVALNGVTVFWWQLLTFLITLKFFCLPLIGNQKTSLHWLHLNAHTIVFCRSLILPFKPFTAFTSLLWHTGLVNTAQHFHCTETRCTLRFDPRSVQPVVSRYTDRVILAHFYSLIFV
jgi:hypothetical protein